MTQMSLFFFEVVPIKQFYDQINLNMPRNLKFGYFCIKTFDTHHTITKGAQNFRPNGNGAKKKNCVNQLSIDREYFCHEPWAWWEQKIEPIWVMMHFMTFGLNDNIPGLTSPGRVPGLKSAGRVTPFSGVLGLAPVPVRGVMIWLTSVSGLTRDLGVCRQGEPY